MAAGVFVGSLIATKDTNCPGVPRAKGSPHPQAKLWKKRQVLSFPLPHARGLDLGRKSEGLRRKGRDRKATSGECATSEEVVAEPVTDRRVGAGRDGGLGSG